MTADMSLGHEESYVNCWFKELFQLPNAWPAGLEAEMLSTKNLLAIVIKRKRLEGLLAKS